MVFVVPELLAAVAATPRRGMLVHVPLEAAGGPESSSTDGTLDWAIGHQFISFCSPSLPVFLLLADILAEVVESLVLAVSVGHDAQLRRKRRIERVQFECECCHRNRWVSDLCRKHSIQKKKCEQWRIRLCKF